MAFAVLEFWGVEMDLRGKHPPSVYSVKEALPFARYVSRNGLTIGGLIIFRFSFPYQREAYRLGNFQFSVTF